MVLVTGICEARGLAALFNLHDVPLPLRDPPDSRVLARVRTALR